MSFRKVAGVVLLVGAVLAVMSKSRMRTGVNVDTFVVIGMVLLALFMLFSKPKAK